MRGQKCDGIRVIVTITMGLGLGVAANAVAGEGGKPSACSESKNAVVTTNWLPNLVPNPGFEDGANGWAEVGQAELGGASFQQPARWESATPHSGKHSYTVSDLLNVNLVSAAIAVAPETEYDLYVWVKCEIDPDESDRGHLVKATCFDSAGAKLGTQSAFSDDTGSSPTAAWRRVGGRITTLPDTSTVKITLGDPLAFGWAVFDDVELRRADYKTPDPDGVNDTFTNGPGREIGDPLDGTLTENGNERWIVTPGMGLGDGVLTNIAPGGPMVATVPVDADRLQSARTVSAEMVSEAPPAVGWVRVGFSSTPTGEFWNDGQVSMLLRDDGGIVVFANSGQIELYRSPIPSPAYQPGPNHLRVVHDTVENTVRAWLNGFELPIPTPDLDDYGFSPDLAYAGIHLWKDEGFSESFEAWADDFALVLSPEAEPETACTTTWVTTHFYFDKDTGLADWNLLGECAGGCGCDGCGAYTPGIGLRFKKGGVLLVDCHIYCRCGWTESDLSFTCGRVCNIGRVVNKSSVDVEAWFQCAGGTFPDPITAPLDSFLMNWTPTIVDFSVTPQGSGDSYDLVVKYEFPQTWEAARELKLYEYDCLGNETSDLICDGELNNITGTCSKTISPSPGTKKLKVVATACGTQSGTPGTAEAEVYIDTPCDKDPWGSSPPDDDPGSCKMNASAGEPIRLTNGNMRYNENLSLASSIGALTRLTYDTLNDAAGAFGLGWFSVFDAHLDVNLASADHRYRIVTETNHSVFFSESFVQTWPGAGMLGELVEVNEGGTDYYRYTDPGARLRRFFRESDGRLARLEVPAQQTAVTIDYDPSGMPTAVTDESGSWAWAITPDATYPDRIGTIVSGDAAWVFTYTGQLLTGVTVDGSQWRSYQYDQYDGEDRLVEATDGAGHLVETHEYDPTTGEAITSQTSGEHVTNIQYQVPSSELPRPLNVAAGEYAARVTWASSRYTDYYIRPVGEAPHRVVELRGDCGCPGGGDYTAFAYDGQGRVVREQNSMGYITVSTYDGQNRIQRVERGHWPNGCDPADYPDDPTVCRLDTDELAETALSPDGMLGATDYTYDETWANKPATVCTESVVEPGQQACDSYTYDPATGVVLTTTRSGYAWDHDTQSSELQSRTTTRTLYDGAEGAVFDPTAAAAEIGVTIVFDPSWVMLPQPQGLVKSVDGPRPPSEVDDTTLFVYYPEDATVLPAELRGRLAARMGADGGVTFFDGDDTLGNITHTIDPSGVATTRQHDSLGRVKTNTLKAVPGCDTEADPLCATDLVTTYQYLGGAGPLEKITSPAGGVTEYGYEGWGRVETVSRGPGMMEERVFTTYDPATDRRASESLQRWEAPSWVEKKRTDYRYDVAGRLSETEYPDTPNPAIETYAYDPAGNVVFFWGPLRYGEPEPNVKYAYDPLGRLVEVRQLEDATLLPTEEAWAVTSYGYDPQSNLTSVTDANGNVTTYSVDDFGQTYQVDSPVSGITKLTYNEAGQVTLKVDGRSATATNTYDVLNRLVSTTSSLSGLDDETVTLSYDDRTPGWYGHGRLTRMTDPAGYTSYRYDRRGNLTTEIRGQAGNIYRTDRTYDAGGNLASVSYPSGRLIEYLYDFAGRPLSATADGATTIVQDAAYRPFGPRDSLDLGNGVSSTMDFDQRYLPSSLTLTRPGPTTLASLTYGDDKAGNITSITDNLDAGFNRSFDYDDLGRLTTANSGTALWGTDPANGYAYDEIGSMTTLQLGPSRTASFDYSGTTPMLSQVTEDGTPPRTVTYDAVGNEIVVGPASYTYSPRNLLTSGDGLEYLYDGRGLRVGVARSVDVPVTALSPAEAEVGGVGFWLTVTGSGFTSEAQVRWDGFDLTTDFVSSTELRAQVSAAEIASAGTAAVTVAQGGSTSNLAPFVVYFHDVAPGYWAYPFVNLMAYKGVTAGCGGGNYCPTSSVTRAQMAVFLLKAQEGEDYSPPACSGVFNDVACPGGFAVDWIEELYNRGITAGCGNDNYCPDDPVSRAQMAVFLLRTKEGEGYFPPACEGIFNDVPCPGGFAVTWIEELSRRGITAGCGGGNFCPNNSVTRASMAVFIKKNWEWASPTVDPYERRYFVYDQAKRLVAESEWVSTWDKPVAYEHVWFGSEPVAQLGPGPSDTHWLVTDHLGTPFMMNDGAANVVWQVDYEPYGQVWSLRLGSDLHQPLRLPGQEAEQLNIGLNGATERYYNVHRWYRSRWGRYSQSDPIGLEGGQNLFLYAFASPLRIVDPLGLYGTNDCSYYDRRCRESGGRYYCEVAPFWCDDFFEKYPDPDPDSDNDYEGWPRCVRKCLQDCDEDYWRERRKCLDSYPYGPDNPDPDFDNFGDDAHRACHVKCYTGCASWQWAVVGGDWSPEP